MSEAQIPQLINEVLPSVDNLQWRPIENYEQYAHETAIKELFEEEESLIDKEEVANDTERQLIEYLVIRGLNAMQLAAEATIPQIKFQEKPVQEGMETQNKDTVVERMSYGIPFHIRSIPNAVIRLSAQAIKKYRADALEVRADKVLASFQRAYNRNVTPKADVQSGKKQYKGQIFAHTTLRTRTPEEIAQLEAEDEGGKVTSATALTKKMIAHMFEQEIIVNIDAVRARIPDTTATFEEIVQTPLFQELANFFEQACIEEFIHMQDLLVMLTYAIGKYNNRIISALNNIIRQEGAMPSKEVIAQIRDTIDKTELTQVAEFLSSYRGSIPEKRKRKRRKTTKENDSN